MTAVVELADRFGAMVTMRAFEEACAEGIRTGDLRGELHLAIGQESVAAGMLGSLAHDDWMVGTHRSHPVALAKGIEPYPLLAEVYERSTGLCGGKGGHMHLFSRAHRFSTTGIVGSSLPVALGHAYASSLEDGGYVAVGMTGDGGTNTGQFFETLNMASIWKLPLVVVVENNGYGISVPASEVIAAPGICARADAFGIWNAQVDGSDVEQVAAVMETVFARARSGLGPVLVEVTCHRYNGHYEGDPDHYRTAEAKQKMHESDPIEVARRRLL
ncbi:MAG: acetoin:2,6-dichlorophenolindophenol oxidoreductase subunit alpha, partial [Nocardioidaceae bacterium]|nr:acetoin:2,6-dichlorophenolindophenol oxidoreductase subunit alpha [Nocardioidaceae bacterium]